VRKDAERQGGYLTTVLIIRLYGERSLLVGPIYHGYWNDLSRGMRRLLRKSPPYITWAAPPFSKSPVALPHPVQVHTSDKDKQIVTCNHHAIRLHTVNDQGISLVADSDNVISVIFFIMT